MSTQDTEQPKSASQIVAEARRTMQEITVVQAREELDQGQAAGSPSFRVKTQQ